jgi:peptidoglycan/xylan/chitin deacetylase (PgdA/CDA1 family)
VAARTSRPPAAVLETPEVQRYLTETTRVWLGCPRSAEVKLPLLPQPLARRLLRLEEYELPERDRWDLWDFESSEDFQAGRLWEPEIDRWVAEQRGELSRQVELEPLWPDGRPFAVCLTHDVDMLSEQSTPRQVVRYARAGLAPGAPGAGERLLRLARPSVRLARSLRTLARTPSTRETLELSVELEVQRGATASYFFTVPPPNGASRYDCVYSPADRCFFRGARRRVADVMRALAEDGFDVGLHGSYHSGLRGGSLAEERQILQRATGLDITTTRQHFLRWEARTTPQLHEAAGLRADSSLGFNRNVGFRAGTSLPFRVFDAPARRAPDVLELPLIVQDAALLGPIGLGVDVERACGIVEQLFGAAAAHGGAVTLVFHPDKLLRPEWRALYEWTLAHAFEAGAWLTSLHRIDEWWRRREARLDA